MTYSLKSWFSFGAAAAVFIGVSQAVIPSNAYAADMLEGEGETLVEFGTGWYLRGDIGGSITTVAGETNVTSGDVDLGETISVSVAAGFEAGDGIRVEFGLSHLTGLSFSGSNGVDCGTELVGLVTVPITGNCSATFDGDVSSSSLTASAFKDFSKVAGFTPYVGLGGGFTYLSSSGVSWDAVCEGTAATDCGVGGGVGNFPIGSGSYAAESAFALTANAMLGASYDISENMKLDFGYKYTYIGSTTLATNSGSGLNQSDLDLESLQNHELRVGIRYAIW